MDVAACLNLPVDSQKAPGLRAAVVSDFPT
jgi:hypothetical protein